MANLTRGAGAAAVVARLTTLRAATWRALCSEFGVSAVRTALRKGHVEAILPGIYAVHGRARETRARATALTLLTTPRGRITGLAAAYLWGVRDDEPSRVTVQVSRHWHLDVPDWARLLRVPVSGRRFRLAGIALVDVPDAVVQSWREAPPDVGASTVIAAIMRQKTTASGLLDALARRKQMPRRGQLAELIGLVGNTVTSYLEYVAWREVFPPRLFPDLQWQVNLRTNGRPRVMDAFDSEAMIDLEFDGGSTHGGVDGFERDRERDADIRSAGIEPLHFTYRDLTERPGWCRQQYLALRLRRLRQLGLRDS